MSKQFKAIALCVSALLFTWVAYGLKFGHSAEEYEFDLLPPLWENLCWGSFVIFGCGALGLAYWRWFGADRSGGSADASHRANNQTAGQGSN